MRIVELTPDRLVFHESPWGRCVFGLLITAMGVWAAAMGYRGGAHGLGHGAWVPLVVGGAFTVVGIAAATTAADCWLVFDKAGKVAQMTRRALHGSATTDYPFSAIRDIALELPPTVRSGANRTYRIVFVLQDGTHAPWTSIWTGDFIRQATCVAAARAFGGWDAASTPPADVVVGSNQPSADAVVRTPNLKVAAVVLALFMVAGVSMTAVEIDHLLMWRPVPALVVGSTVATVRSSKGGPTYKPVVDYRYMVGGTSYESNEVNVVSVSRGQAWAASVSARYVPGMRTTAYVDPSDPRHAFLVHEMSFLPLIFVLMPLVAGALLTVSTRAASRSPTLAGGVTVPILTSDGQVMSRVA